MTIARAASLIGDPTRAALLITLLDGRAQPATALAHAAAVSPQVASNHLARLVGGGLLSVMREGRHRYYRLASPEVGQALEALAVLNAQTPPRPIAPPADPPLRFARSCYDHLAGRLGVAVLAALMKRGCLAASAADSKLLEVTALGRRCLGGLDIDVEAAPRRRPLARCCLDWTERRPHLAGWLGAQLLTQMRTRRWVTAQRRGRQLHLTPEGMAGLKGALGVDSMDL